MPIPNDRFFIVTPPPTDEQRAGYPGPLFNGIIQMSGRPDAGKTSFIFESGVHPGDILFVDDDVKGIAIVKEMAAAGTPLGGYLNLVALRKEEKLTELGLFKRVESILTSIEPGRYKLLAWDTWTYFASAIKAFVATNRPMFRSSWAPMGTIAGAQEWQEAGLYELAILDMLQTKYEINMIILLSHMKDDYAETAGGKTFRTGKQVPAVSKATIKGSLLRMIIERPVSAVHPYAIVTKQLSRRVMVPGAGLRTLTVTPHRLTCRGDEQSLWDVLRRYYADPIGNRPPEPDETVTAEEAEAAMGAWGKYDLEIIKALAADANSPIPEIDPMAPRIVAAFLGGKTINEVSADMGIPIPVVIKMLQDAGVEAA